MKMEEDLIIEKLDLDYFLGSYLRSYLFYNKNEAPKKIVVPMVPAIKNLMSGEMVPVVFTALDTMKIVSISPEEALTQPSESTPKKEPKKK